MSKFNRQTVDEWITDTTNYEGGYAFDTTKVYQLTSFVLTSFVQNQFYRSEFEVRDAINKLIEEVDLKYIAKLAIYARREFGMRSITHILAGELAKSAKGKSWLKDFLYDVVYRVDDMSEILGYYQGEYGKRPIPNSIKGAFRKILSSNKFDEYQLAKYQMKNYDWSLRDIVNITHPKPTPENASAFEKLMKDELKQHNTWENELSETGKSASDEEELKKLKQKKWTELVENNKLGYFGLLRNLRNIIKYAKNVDKAIETLVDENRIQKSLVLPFRYWTAFKTIANSENLPEIDKQKVLGGIGKATEISFQNIPNFDGKTLVAVDKSLSMNQKLSNNSNAILAEIAALFGYAFWKRNMETDLIFFDGRKYKVNQLKSTNIMTLMNNTRFDGGGTDFSLIFDTNVKYDRIIILSDMQSWIKDKYFSKSTVEFYKEYRKRTNANPHIYSWDLAGYGTLQFPEDRIYMLSGFSEKIFDVMKMLEKNKTALIDKIQNVKIG